MPFPVLSAILEYPKVSHSFSFLAEKNSKEFNCFEAKLLFCSFPKGKRGTMELFPISQPAPYIVDIPTQQTLGQFTPNQVYLYCLGLHIHDTMATCPSEVVHWPKDKVSHLADTITQQTSGRLTSNQVISHLSIWGCP